MTTPKISSQIPKPTALAKKSSSAVEDTHSQNDQGQTTIADVVVAKIAGIAVREINGVYDLGGNGAARVVGKIRDSIPVGSRSLTQGVDVEVGQRQAAIEIGIIVDYGTSIQQVTQAIRSNVIRKVERLTGLEVVEVNITVHDLHVYDDDKQEDSGPKVQ